MLGDGFIIDCIVGLLQLSIALRCMARMVYISDVVRDCVIMVVSRSHKRHVCYRKFHHGLIVSATHTRKDVRCCYYYTKSWVIR